MDSWIDVLGWVLAGIMFVGALVLTFLNIKSGGKPVHSRDLWDKLNEAQSVAREAVAAVEQLYNSGQIEAGDRADQAIDYVLAYLPGIPKLQAEFLVEAAVYWLKRKIERDARATSASEPIEDFRE